MTWTLSFSLSWIWWRKRSFILWGYCSQFLVSFFKMLPNSFTFLGSICTESTLKTYWCQHIILKIYLINFLIDVLFIFPCLVSLRIFFNICLFILFNSGLFLCLMRFNYNTRLSAVFLFVFLAHFILRCCCQKWSESIQN